MDDRDRPWGPDDLAPGEFDCEERVTLWQSPDADAALALAEAEAEQYVASVGGEVLTFAQSYSLSDDLRNGVEVFSLIRRSPLTPEDYIDRHFDAGTAHRSRDHT